MLQLTIVDDGGSVKKGNYKWSVISDQAAVMEGAISGHQRAKGWKKLLKKATNAVMKVPERPEQLELPAFTPEHAA